MPPPAPEYCRPGLGATTMGKSQSSVCGSGVTSDAGSEDEGDVPGRSRPKEQAAAVTHGATGP